MKIAVLMSGGIDSSFAALYLKEKGYNVIGVSFLQLGKVLQEEQLSRIKKIAKIFSIPYFVFDIKEVFEKEIIEPTLQDFHNGITPNPCPFCNKKIKFGLVFSKAKKLGAEKIATGHYAKVKYVNSKKRWILKKGEDESKDQSYFLWQLDQEQLSKIIFPLGIFKKREIKRKMRKRFPKEIDVFKCQETHDICFLRGGKLSQFLRKEFKENPGPIYNLKGKIIGEHPGIQFFTIGQRQGLKIGAKVPKQKPVYVIEINRAKKAIIVGEEKYLFKRKLEAGNLNWVSIKTPKEKFKAMAKIRYRHKEKEVQVQPLSKKRVKVVFKKLQRAITPGQHIVFYKKDLLLGGGIIEKVK